VVVGLVGEPNVGKSSTLNALLGSHRVAVSSHPGRTKHYQTHYVSRRLVLCDCPGLVFPRLDVSLPVQARGPRDPLVETVPGLWERRVAAFGAICAGNRRGGPPASSACPHPTSSSHPAGSCGLA
jgi:hypothetical protein